MAYRSFFVILAVFALGFTLLIVLVAQAHAKHEVIITVKDDGYVLDNKLIVDEMFVR